jgi:hypothetical protein
MIVTYATPMMPISCWLSSSMLNQKYWQFFLLEVFDLLVLGVGAWRSGDHDPFGGIFVKVGFAIKFLEFSDLDSGSTCATRVVKRTIREFELLAEFECFAGHL